MFFFIAGIQPKTIEIEGQSRMCPSCGLYQSRLKRVDHYFSVFFLPLFRVRKGRPYMECRSCGGLFSESGQPWVDPPAGRTKRCANCGEALHPGFRYCPSCGKQAP